MIWVEPVVVDALAAAGVAAARIVQVTPATGQHRHDVWRVLLDGCPCDVVLKVQTPQRGVQPVLREAEVLRCLRSHAGVPTFVASGEIGRNLRRPFLLTETLPGVPLASWLDLDRAPAPGQLEAYARWLHEYSLADALAEALRPTTSDFHGAWAATYSPGAAPPVVLGRLADGRLINHHNRLAVVHGSFDPGNILVTDDQAARLSGIVDYEATRLGSPLIDIAGLALHFLTWCRVDLAWAWLLTAATTWGWPELPGDALPYLLAQRGRRRAAATVDPSVWLPPERLVNELLGLARREGR